MKRQVFHVDNIETGRGETSEVTQEVVVDKDKEAIQNRIEACGFIERGDVNKINKDKMYDWFRNNGDGFLKGEFKFIGNALYRFNGKNWVYASGDTINKCIYQKFHKLYDVDAPPDAIQRVFSICKNMEYIKEQPNWSWYKTKSYEHKVFIPFQNGTLELDLDAKTHTFHAGVWDKESDAVYCLNIDFEENMIAQEFWKDNFVGKYLQEYYTENELESLQQFLGSVLIPEFESQQCLIILGNGGDGKGVLTSTVGSLLGDSVSHLPVSRWEGSHDTTALLNSVLNVTGEAPSRELNVELFKSITACDPLNINPKFERNFSYIPFSKHIITVNELPRIPVDPAISRRVVIIQTIKSASEEERTPFFKIDFEQNRAALVSFMIQGILLLKSREFKNIIGNEELKREFIHHNNSVVDDFAEDCLEITSVDSDFTSSKDMFNVYERWKTVNAQNAKDMTKDKFSKNLMDLIRTKYNIDAKHIKKIAGKTERGFKKILLKAEWIKEEW